MPDGVEVKIENGLIISALNTPGQPVYQWRDQTGIAVTNRAYSRSPVNKVNNARHRGGVVGTYKRSWSWDRQGNQHRVRAVIYNTADHADIVEFGRDTSQYIEKFSWTHHRPPGAIWVHFYGTRGRKGKHVLRNAVNSVMPTRTDNYTPLA